MIIGGNGSYPVELCDYITKAIRCRNVVGDGHNCLVLECFYCVDCSLSPCCLTVHLVEISTRIPMKMSSLVISL